MKTMRIYYTRQALARHFGVPASRINEWVAAGCPCINPALKTQRQKWAHLLFKLPDVERWLSSFTQPEPRLTQLQFDFH